MTNKINKFETLAIQTANAVNTSKQSNAEKTGNQNSLSFLVLNILVCGNVQEIGHIAKAFAKDGGKFHSLRMILSRAKVVAKELNEKQSVTIKTKKETLTFPIDIVKDWNIENQEIPFNVSSAYNTIKASLEVEIKEESKESLEKRALAAYQESLALDTATFNSMVDIGSIDRQEAVNSGLVILDNQVKEEKAASLPALAETIRAQFMELYLINENMAKDLLLSLAPKNHKKTA